MTGDALERVLGRMRVVHGFLGGCWIYTGARVANPRGGYGKIKVNGRVHRVHRWLWRELMGEPAPPLLDHLCRVRPCGNPGHLQPSTVKENTKNGRSGVVRR
jgi:hypothetical protein